LWPLCDRSAFVDSRWVSLQGGTVTHHRKYALSQLVPASRKAFGSDELLFFTGSGVLLGASDPARIGIKDPTLAAYTRSDTTALYLDSPPRIVAHCVKSVRSAKGDDNSKPTIRVGMRAEKHLSSILARLSQGSGLLLSLTPHDPEYSWSASIQLDELPGVSLYAVPAEDRIDQVMAEVNRQVWLW